MWEGWSVVEGRICVLVNQGVITLANVREWNLMNTFNHQDIISFDQCQLRHKLQV